MAYGRVAGDQLRPFIIRKRLILDSGNAVVSYLACRLPASVNPMSLGWQPGMSPTPWSSKCDRSTLLPWRACVTHNAPRTLPAVTSAPANKSCNYTS